MEDCLIFAWVKVYFFIKNVRPLLVESSVIIFYVIFLMRYAVLVNYYLVKKKFSD